MLYFVICFSWIESGQSHCVWYPRLGQKRQLAFSLLSLFLGSSTLGKPAAMSRGQSTSPMERPMWRGVCQFERKALSPILAFTWLLHMSWLTSRLQPWNSWLRNLKTHRDNKCSLFQSTQFWGNLLCSNRQLIYVLNGIGGRGTLLPLNPLTRWKVDVQYTILDLADEGKMLEMEEQWPRWGLCPWWLHGAESANSSLFYTREK